MVNAQRFRARKVDLKRSLPVYRAADLDDLDDDDNRQVDAIETGVEKDEEGEHHLQAAISASLAAASGSAPAKHVYIPTPDASRVAAEYDRLYARGFTCPTGLIRSSETVEESCAPMYCADDVDMAWLEGRSLTTDAFEAAMDALETLTRDMVFATAADVPSAAYLASYAAERDRPLSRSALDAVYEHWRDRRVARASRPIMPQLQSEDAPRADIDPYVCFRRREVRQGRKTRRADQRSLEQLKRLRVNLAAAAQVLEMCAEREREKTQLVAAAQDVARQRQAVLRMRRRLNLAVSSDADDLFVPPAQQQQRRRAQTQRPRAAATTRKPRTVSGLASALQNQNQGLSLAAAAGSADGSGALLPFALPPSVSVMQHPAPRRLAAMADRIAMRAQSYESRLCAGAGWVDTTFSSPASFAASATAAPAWAPLAASSAAFRLRVGRLGRLFIDRRAVRPLPLPVDAQTRRLQTYCAGLLKPEDHARLKPMPVSSAQNAAAAALEELLKPFSFGDALTRASQDFTFSQQQQPPANSLVQPVVHSSLLSVLPHVVSPPSELSLLSGSTVGGFPTPKDEKENSLNDRSFADDDVTRDRPIPLLKTSASTPAVTLFSGGPG
ncbi:Enhancer of polycomb-like protein 1 [Coemansia sp. Benny D115]|nr:Enhancer of polycomb-like protein 1 [Coemansia sp. Benny D115]